MVVVSIVAAHPRSRGENQAVQGQSSRAFGSSPLTRGKHHHTARGDQQNRLIPAHAGKTYCRDCPAQTLRAHPRSRGENKYPTALGMCARGSSPLTRGKLTYLALALPHHRLIPAHAGKTRRRPCNRRRAAAHPRSRGENPWRSWVTRASRGSSPLTRGKLSSPCDRSQRGRLIPAHAGKTLPDMRFYCADRSDLGNP